MAEAGIARQLVPGYVPAPDRRSSLTLAEK